MYENVMDQPLLICGFLTLPVGWSASLHQHPHAELVLVAQGSMVADIDGHTQTAGAGDLLLYPPGARHRERNAGRRQLCLFYVHGRLEPLPAERLVDRDGRLSLLVRWLVEDRAAGAPANVLAGWMQALRAQLQLCATADGDTLAGAIRTGMRAQPGRQRSVAELARSAGLGPRQFLRRYRSETGSTPMADLRRLRCETAADLLVSTDWPLARIASEVGFCDAFHFSKVFRSHYGLPPGRMRSRSGGRR